MAFFVYPGGHDMAKRINLDGLGQLYIAVFVAWTTLILGGMAFLFVNRNLSYLRMCNIHLGIAAVSTLHVYWCLCMLAYVLNGYFPCGIEYWVMSTFLPLGIALYQANSTQLLHVAGLQKRFMSQQLLFTGPKASVRIRGWRRLLSTWNSVGFMKRAMICIAVGSMAQIIAAFLLFVMSRRFHASWGVFGHAVSARECRKGLEWLPSIAWQFTWAWLYAPYLLWKIRGINDVHGWRAQTFLCSLAGLLGTPMWLITTYEPAFRTINRYWVPPLWFSPGIVVMESLVIFFPCWQVLKSRRLQKETLDIIAQWETKQHSKSSHGVESIASGPTLVAQSVTSSKAGSTSSGVGRRGEMYTMNALEKALEANSGPLLRFSALKDFSGENICFLNQVREWKANWAPPSGRYTMLRKAPLKLMDSDELQRRQFSLAVEIYSLFVSMSYSDTPINLSSAHQKELETLFEGAASLINDHVPQDSATPFCKMEKALIVDLESGVETKSASFSITEKSTASTDEVTAQPADGYFSLLKTPSSTDAVFRVPFDFAIPESFGVHAFDNAEKSIKYMVLTNTWPRFVASGQAGRLEHKGVLANMKDKFPMWTEECKARWTCSTRK